MHNVFAHRLEQAGKVECRAIRGRGVGAGVLVPKPLVEQQITVDKHGDAVGVGAIRRIAMMLRRLSRLLLFTVFGWLTAVSGFTAASFCFG